MSKQFYCNTFSPPEHISTRKNGRAHPVSLIMPKIPNLRANPPKTSSRQPIALLLTKQRAAPAGVLSLMRKLVKEKACRMKRARGAVFSTVELLEMILEHLSLIYLLSARVCRQWKMVMESSSLLQAKLFLSLRNEGEVWRCDQRVWQHGARPEYASLFSRLHKTHDISRNLARGDFLVADRLNPMCELSGNLNPARMRHSAGVTGYITILATMPLRTAIARYMCPKRSGIEARTVLDTMHFTDGPVTKISCSLQWSIGGYRGCAQFSKSFSKEGWTIGQVLEAMLAHDNPTCWLHRSIVARSWSEKTLREVFQTLNRGTVPGKLRIWKAIFRLRSTLLADREARCLIKDEPAKG
ncbi:hypothetical protein Slin14017_G091840 [Septoria linicola]|nr:hypothetical protein Slin14017_G091840 [Septoria linicola]